MYQKIGIGIITGLGIVLGVGVGVYRAWSTDTYHTTQGPLEPMKEVAATPEARDTVVGAARHTVYLTQTSYAPQPLTVQRNEIIAFKNVSKVPLKPAGEGINPQGFIYPERAWLTAFSQPGTYTIYDVVYPDVQLRIIVE